MLLYTVPYVLVLHHHMSLYYCLSITKTRSIHHGNIAPFSSYSCPCRPRHALHHGHFIPSLYCPHPLQIMPVMPHAHYALGPLCFMSIIVLDHYALATLYTDYPIHLTPLLSYTHYVPACPLPLCPMPHNK